MADASDGLDVFRKAFGESQAPLTEAQRQIRRNAAVFALTAFGFDYSDTAEQAKIGVKLTEEQLEAAKILRHETITDLPVTGIGALESGYGSVSSLIAEAIPIQLELITDTENHDREGLEDMRADPSGMLLLRRHIGKMEEEAAQAVIENQDKKGDALMMYRLLIRKVKDLPDKPINVKGDVDEETAAMHDALRFAEALGADVSPRNRAAQQGVGEIFTKTGFVFDEKGDVSSYAVLRARGGRLAFDKYKSAVDQYMTRWGNESPGE